MADESRGYLSEVIDVERSFKTGAYGEVYIVSCRVLEGSDKGRIIKVNIVGPIKKGDLVRLSTTSREARDIKPK
ncbi:MAG: 30S ribosomal protein S28e [Candidatus Micrarchaeota archaeon]|nr:MAG: 30S ribosomal protein S28e [Candidatus Micrarchaeota archaeon]